MLREGFSLRSKVQNRLRVEGGLGGEGRLEGGERGHRSGRGYNNCCCLTIRERERES